MKDEKTIDPNKLKGRDPFILDLIAGANKSAVYPDQKKDQNKKLCRKKIDNHED